MSNNVPNNNSTGFGKNVFWESHFFSPLRRELLDGKNSQILSQITPLKDITNEIKRPLNNPIIPASKRILLVSPETPKLPEISFDPQLQSTKKLDFDFNNLDKGKIDAETEIILRDPLVSADISDRVRSEKSLVSLCERFLDLHGRIQVNPIQIQLEDCATKLGVNKSQRRRLYDVVNILESLEILRRIGIDAYIYYGLTVLPESLYNIYQSGQESCVVIGRKHLTLWTRNLVKKLLDLPISNPQITLSEAEESLFQTGEVSEESDRKKLVESRSRRLYDIMNILKFLGIADKSRYGDRKNTFIRRMEDRQSENIKTILRIRPFTELEIEKNEHLMPSSLEVVPPNSVKAKAANIQKPEIFSYDQVADSGTSQEEIFEMIGREMADNCLEGYNGTIFAYGQTSSGKTFTLNGCSSNDLKDDGDLGPRRGLIPRILEYLFSEMEKRNESENIQFLCKCSYVEIYNEVVYDLLDSSGPLCSLREDIKRGVYLYDNYEETVTSATEGLRVFQSGNRNRHVAETAMNRESSRSHAVFTLMIQSKRMINGITNLVASQFHIVDLAGSERQSLTGTTGLRLKEAGNINKSLLALGHVINSLLDIANGRTRHVHYRDSKLTFLLKDSLGGNAKTAVIVNVSPSSVSYPETMSTLRFGKRVKMVKNKAILNRDFTGDLKELQAELSAAKIELEFYKNQAVFKEIPSDVSDESKNGLLRNLLKAALERQQVALIDNDVLQEKCTMMMERIKCLENHLKTEKMIVGFRDNRIEHLKQKSISVNDDDEITLLEAEILEIRNQLQNHPDVSRLQFENYQIREKFRKLEDYVTKYQAYCEKMQSLEKYERELANHVILLTQDSPVSCENEDNLELLAKIRLLSDEKVTLSEQISGYEYQMTQANQKMAELESSLNMMKLNQKIEEIREGENMPFDLLKVKLKAAEKKARRLSDFAFESQNTFKDQLENMNSKYKSIVEENHVLISKLEDLKRTYEIVSQEKEIQSQKLGELEKELKLQKTSFLTENQKHMKFQEDKLRELEGLYSQLETAKDDLYYYRDKATNLETELVDFKEKIHGNITLLNGPSIEIPATTKATNVDCDKIDMDILIKSFNETCLKWKEEKDVVNALMIEVKNLKEDLGRISDLLSNSVAERDELCLVLQRFEAEETRLLEKTDELEKKLDIEQTLILTLRNDNTSLLDQVSDLKLANDGLTKELDQIYDNFDKDLVDNEIEKGSKDDAINTTTNTSNPNNKRGGAFSFQIKQVSERQKSLSLALAHLEEAKAAKEIENEKLRKDIEALKKNSNENLENMKQKLDLMMSDQLSWNQREHKRIETISDYESKLQEKESSHKKLIIEKKKLEFLLKTSQDDNEELLQEIDRINSKYSEEKENILSKESLENELQDLKSECQRLRAENAKLIQHQNMKQKLQYHVKIKEENNDLKREVRELREELNKLISHQ